MRSGKAVATHRETRAQWVWLAPFLVLICGIASYRNSFHGPFIFDDIEAIVNRTEFGGNPAGDLPTLAPRPPGPMSTTLTSRPVLWLTFKVDYLLAGQQVEIYHLNNLLIHLAAGLVLYGIVRRNLLRKEYWGNEFENSAPWLAATVAAMWVSHPLTTESVTYIVQRAESLAGLFYFAMLYCVVRATDDAGGKNLKSVKERKTSVASLWWQAGAVGACLLGLGSKEILATAPVVVLIYDRTFLAGSFARAWKARKGLYVSLFATWILVVFLIVSGKGRGETVGFSVVSAGDYARTQLGAIAHYLQLTFWPVGLVLAIFDWPLVQHWDQIGAGGFLVVGLVALWLVALWKKPVLGFLGAWFFLILAPSSSVVPIRTEIIADHRMYLSLAAPIALVVIGGWRLAVRGKVQWLAEGAAVVATICLIWLTMLRNEDYRTAISIWSDTVAKRPGDVPARYNLADAYWLASKAAKADSPEAHEALKNAETSYRRVLEDKPTAHPAALMLARTLVSEGQTAEAEAYCDSALVEHPTLAADLHKIRGWLRFNRKDMDGAKSDFLAAIALHPNDAQGYLFLSVVLRAMKDDAGAKAQIAEAERLSPDVKQMQEELDRQKGNGAGSLPESPAVQGSGGKITTGLR